MVLGDNPAADITSPSSWTSLFLISLSGFVPRLGSTHLSRQCSHPAIVAGFTGRRRRVDRDSIHLLACCLKVVAGVVFSAKCSTALIPCDSMNTRSLAFARARVGQIPSATVLRTRSVGVSTQTRP